MKVDLMRNASEGNTHLNLYAVSTKFSESKARLGTRLGWVFWGKDNRYRPCLISTGTLPYTFKPCGKDFVDKMCFSDCAAFIGKDWNMC
jgi:hypothetical protein